MKLEWIFIAGNVPSLKNSKEIVSIWRKYSSDTQLVTHKIIIDDRKPLEVKLLLDLRNMAEPPAIRTRMPMLIPSKTHKRYETASAMAYREMAKHFHRLAEGHSTPLKVGFYFVRDSKRKFDYGNSIASCEDIMTTRGWIPDDNCNEILSIPIGYHVDKENAGVYICVLPDDFINVEPPVKNVGVVASELDLFGG